jgi:tetratricopeptide (TPR) repeat protein
MARTILTTLVLLATATALFLTSGSTRNGCLWDSDTLRAEAAGAPGMVETIVGRFDRYPPLYYQMRLDRAAADVATNPADLNAYDDAAVSCDRLGKHDEAIAWMAQKRTALDALPESEARADHEYRYLANLGTFHAHRWLANGADRADMADMEQARDLIRQAIALNPDAHFGRERYQLMALEWILEPTPVDDGRYPMGYYTSILDRIAYDDGWPGVSYRNDLAKAGYPDAPEGFAGLVALGNGWNSFDVFHALALALQDRQDSSLAYLAWLRAEEILASGGGTLHPEMDLSDFDPAEHPYHLNAHAPVEAFYTKARAEADAWHQARTAYITTRLEQGEHPDTHPAFFAAWVEPSRMPTMPNGLFGLQGTELTMLTLAMIPVGLLGAIVLVALALTVRHIRRRKRRRASASPTTAPA